MAVTQSKVNKDAKTGNKETTCVTRDAAQLVPVMPKADRAFFGPRRRDKEHVQLLFASRIRISRGPGKSGISQRLPAHPDCSLELTQRARRNWHEPPVLLRTSGGEPSTWVPTEVRRAFWEMRRGQLPNTKATVAILLRSVCLMTLQHFGVLGSLTMGGSDMKETAELACSAISLS